MTIVKQATVKIMLSYDYCHFEVSQTIENENGILPVEVDETRKTCQRLADKAVGQYQKAKSDATKRAGSSYERQQLRNEVAEIRKKPEHEWDLIEKAKVKTLSDYDHQAKYNYDDDSEYHPF